MKSELDNLNQEFLKCLERSFLKYLEKGAKGVRGTGKLKILHPHIANDLRNILGDKFWDALIFNNYQEFIKKCAYLVEGFFGK